MQGLRIPCFAFCSLCVLLFFLRFVLSSFTVLLLRKDRKGWRSQVGEEANMFFVSLSCV